jgi:hypothetical protein
MSVYSELLRMTMQEDDQQSWDVPRLVAELVKRRSELHEVSETWSAPSATLRYSLAYDAGLVRLCRELGVEERLTSGSVVTVARPQAEQMLVERLPLIASVLSNLAPQL